MIKKLNTKTLTLGISILLFLLSPVALFNSRAYAAIVINEIFPKPADGVSEWIEVYNNGPDPVSLEGWKLENTTGEKKTYTIPTNNSISSGGFLTFFQSQTDIKLNDEGDTVRLLDTGNTQIDSQTYPSILGFNGAVGRSEDGAGSWVICVTSTANQPNNCPQPTPTIVPTPTPLPTTTPVPTLTPTPLPTTTPKPTPTDTPQKVLGITVGTIRHSTNSSDTSYQQAETRWKIGMGILAGGIAVAGLLLLINHFLKNRKKLTKSV